MDHAPGTPKLEEMISYRVSRLQTQLNRQAIAILKENGKISPTQWRVLVMLNSLESCTTAQISRATGFDKALLSRAVKGMVERGLVTACPSRENKSHSTLRMTRAGVEAFEQARPFMQERHNNLIGCLTTTERKALFSALSKLEAEITRSGQVREQASLAN